METKHILLLAGALVLALVVVATSGVVGGDGTTGWATKNVRLGYDYCSDFESGTTHSPTGLVNYSAAGTVTANTTNGTVDEFSDYCINESYVMEQYCLNGNPTEINQICPGNDTCVTDKCVPQSCSDPDGVDIFTNSNISFVNESGSFMQADYCLGSDEINEWVCNGTSVNYNITGCPFGYECSDGACVLNQTNQTTFSCQDTDGGIVNNTSGNVTITIEYGINSTTDLIDFSSDRCRNTSRLVEYYCQTSTSDRKSILEVDCNCSLGACINSS